MDHTYPFWEPIVDFRISLIKTFWSQNYHLAILDRRCNIIDIKVYKCTHKGKYPKRPCSEVVLTFLLGKPNRLKYDFDCELNSIKFRTITTNFIKLYNQLFIERTLRFQKKYLITTHNKNMEDIDKYYDKFKNAIIEKEDVKKHDSINSRLSSSSMSVTKPSSSILKKKELRSANSSVKIYVIPKKDNQSSIHLISSSVALNKVLEPM